MAIYTINISRGAEKSLLKLPDVDVKKIVKAIDGLKDVQKPKGSKKLKGATENLWRIRIGDYRVIYMIQDTLEVIDIRKIGHRKDIYD